VERFFVGSTTTVLYVYPLGSTLKNKDTTSYASSYNHGKRKQDRKKKIKKEREKKEKSL